MDKLERTIDDLRRRWVPDARLGVFEVRVEDAPRRLAGQTTSRDALEALRRLGGDAGLDVDLTPLPDASLGGDTAAILTAAIAPLLEHPKLNAARVNEVLHGEPLALLERRDGWLRVRVGDGYHGWMHAGYVATGAEDWAADWTGRATARSLGLEVVTPDGRRRLPIGARVAPRRDGTVELADGRVATVKAGAARAEAEIRTEARMLAVPELALRWFSGAPYLWGGRTEWGIDCSGLAQSVYAARGIALLRDSDLQVTQGGEVPVDPRGAGYEAGDLLYFAENGRVSHVALWAGGGAGRIVHSALSRGGVSGDDLFGESAIGRRLRGQLVAVRRPEARRP
jgi:hypothetical protein